MKVRQKGSVERGGSDESRENFPAAVLAFVPEGRDVAWGPTFNRD